MLINPPINDPEILSKKKKEEQDHTHNNNNLEQPDTCQANKERKKEQKHTCMYLAMVAGRSQVNSLIY